MRPEESLEELRQFTTKAIREIPKTWQRISESYIQKVTRRDIVRLNLLAVATGIIAGYAAIGFRYLIGTLQNLFMYHQFDYHLISPSDHIRGAWILVITPLGLLVSAYLTKWFAPEAKGHGVPEVIESVLTRGGRIRKRIVAIKALASSITIASGGSVGREGPIVQIGSAAGSAFGQLINLPPKLLKTLVGCGAAGAVAATFNTPVAGVIFAIEIIVLELKTKSFVPLVISSVFATVISRAHLGNEPAFFVPTHALVDHRELVFYLGLGILSGIVGVLLIKTLYATEDFFHNLKIPFVLKPIGGGLIIASLGMLFPQVLGVGYEAITDVLQQSADFNLVFALIFLKIIAMSITLAAGGSGGVFAPSLFVGAMLGGAYGMLVNQFYPEISAGYGAYALVGMAAMFSATGRATFTAIVILFEMTLDYSIILPLMFVCVIADQLSWALHKESIYSLKLARKGLSFVTDIGVNVMAVTLIKDIMTTEVQTAPNSMTLGEAREKLMPSSHSVYPVIDEEGVLTGMVQLDAITKGLTELGESATIEQVKQPTRVVVYPDDNVMSAVKKIEKTRDPRIIVVERKSRRLVGIVSPIDFVRLSSTEVE